MATKSWQGSKWIRRERRLAIYLRDGMACVYCGDSVEDGAQLTLDHIVCRCKGGDNGSTNLVTSCDRCNSRRGNRSVSKFVKGVSAYTGEDAEIILKRIHNCRRRKVPMPQALTLIKMRGTYSSVMTALAS